MTKNVDRLTSSPRKAETAIATTAAHVYSYLQTSANFHALLEASVTARLTAHLRLGLDGGGGSP